MMPFSLLSAGADGAAGTPAWVALAYLIAGVFFIFALRGLSSPSTSPERPQSHCWTHHGSTSAHKPPTLHGELA